MQMRADPAGEDELVPPASHAGAAPGFDVSKLTVPAEDLPVILGGFPD